MKDLLRVLVVLAVVLVVVGFAIGWITYRQTGDKAAIEIDGGKVKQSADQAVEKGKELLKDAQDSLEPAEKPPESP